MKSFNPGAQYTYKSETETIRGPQPSVLDGVTLFRFAHMSRNVSSGGVESYLKNLNRHLLGRNKMQILQMYLTPESEPYEVEVEEVGQGKLIWIPSLESNFVQPTSKAGRIWAKLRRRMGTHSLVNHDILLSTLANYQINLAVFHWISEDSEIIIDYFNKRRVPIVVVNHFHNARLKRYYIRRQISEARAIGGVSNVDVPSFIRSRFTNLSDGVDTDFFHPGKAVSLERKIKDPLIMLPSRITEGKGHLDAIRALGCLSREGISANLAFAGRLERPAFMDKLRRIISEEGVQERVIFAGELSPEELRNWYAAAIVVILPTYSEGLGKILLEAQSMAIPAVAYEAGGVAEAMQHGSGGFLVRIGDFDGLANRLKELLENQGKRCAMGQCGRKFVVEKFSLVALTVRHEEFYATNLNKSALI